MDQEKLDRLVESARQDMLRGDSRKAKDRLRAVLQLSPHFRPALELMGRIYYQHGDYRNAVMHWSRADYWQYPMPHACERIFKAVWRALVRENAQAARHHLYAFAGTLPPGELRERLSILQAAYYRLGAKKSKLAGLACAPLSGGCLLAAVGLISVLLGAGWSWFAWMGAIAVAAALVVACINALAYFRASRLFREAVTSFQKTAGR